jgi:elongation factor G
MSDPEPRSRRLLSVAIAPKDKSDGENLLRALNSLLPEHWTAEIQSDFDGGKVLLSGDYELELQTICHRISHEYKIRIDVGEVKVAFRETIRKAAEAEGKYIRQVGGSGNYGHCMLRVEPNEPNKGYEFINDIHGGVVPKKYIDSIDRGVREALELGILAGFPIVDLKVTLFDGSYHEVDSNEMAFTFAGSIAFKEAARKASPVLLEPVMAVEITVPKEQMGAIADEISSRRGRIEGMEHHLVSVVVEATIPLAELLGVRRLRGCVYSNTFARYEKVIPGGGSDGGGAGITAQKPDGPKGKSGSAFAKSDEEPE